MACSSCSKRKASQAANALRANRILYRPTPVVQGLAESHALDGPRYRRVRYLVAPRDAIASGELADAEAYMTLAEAQKRIRDLGPLYGVKATRD